MTLETEQDSAGKLKCVSGVMELWICMECPMSLL